MATVVKDAARNVGALVIFAVFLPAIVVALFAIIAIDLVLGE